MQRLNLLLPVLALGCSPTLFQPTPCESSDQCANVFGAGATCDVDGYCALGNEDFVDGVSAGAVRTVGIADVTGSLQDLGGGMRDGVLAALQAHNRDNPSARQFLHDTLDDAYDPQISVSNLRSVLDGDGVNEGRSHFAVLGGMGSPTTSAMLPVINSNQVPLFGTYSGAEHLRATPPDRVVFNTRASYRLEGEAIGRYLLHRTPVVTQIAPDNVFVFAQSALTIETNGLTDIGATAEDDLDPYGLSGFLGIRDALREAGQDNADIALASYRATNTDTSIASDYFFRWLLGLERLKPDIPESGQVRIGVAMVPVASAATPFVKEVIDGLADIEQGKPPPGVSAQEWADTPATVKSQLQQAQVVITSISPVGDQLAANLRNSNAAKYCQGADGRQPVIVSQVVPFPTGGSAGAVQYRQDLEAYDPNLDPGFVSFEGWIAGRAWVEAVLATGDDLSVDTLVATLEDPSFSVNVGEVLSFSPDDHDGSDSVYGSIIDVGCTYVDYSRLNDLNPQ